MSAPSLPTTDRVHPVPVDAIGNAAGRCPACPHAMADHDTISSRYCSASEVSGVLSRGCVCPKR
jgi:hypothetical protein